MTKSIRIKNSNNNNEKATIQPIGEFYCNVTWDDEPAKNFQVAKHQVDDLLANGSWIEIDDNELPDSFKFIVENVLQDFFVATKRENNYHVTWNESISGACYSVEEVEHHIEAGNWKIIKDDYKDNWATATTYHQGEKVMRGDVPFTILDKDSEQFIEAQQALEERMGNINHEQQDILERIKEFTNQTGHSVEIVDGGYRVYREDEFDSYNTDCEHCLMDIMNAIDVLDEHSENI